VPAGKLYRPKIFNSESVLGGGFEQNLVCQSLRRANYLAILDRPRPNMFDGLIRALSRLFWRLPPFT
jgi:hypothetical protein